MTENSLIITKKTDLHTFGAGPFFIVSPVIL